MTWMMWANSGRVDEISSSATRNCCPREVGGPEREARQHMGKMEYLKIKNEELNTRCDKVSKKHMLMLYKTSASEGNNQEATETSMQKITTSFEKITTMEKIKGGPTSLLPRTLFGLNELLQYVHGEIKAL